MGRSDRLGCSLGQNNLTAFPDAELVSLLLYFLSSCLDQRLSGCLRIACHANSNCASGHSLKQSPGGFAGSSLRDGRPKDVQPHLVTVDLG